jgi:hypothetical protein
VEIARKAGHLPLETFDKRLARVDGAEHLQNLSAVLRGWKIFAARTANTMRPPRAVPFIA